MLNCGRDDHGQDFGYFCLIQLNYGSGKNRYVALENWSYIWKKSKNNPSLDNDLRRRLNVSPFDAAEVEWFWFITKKT